MKRKLLERFMNKRLPVRYSNGQVSTVSFALWDSRTVRVPKIGEWYITHIEGGLYAVQCIREIREAMPIVTIHPNVFL